MVDVFLLSLTSVQINCVPRWTSLEVTLERSLQGRLDSVLLGWTRHGRLEQVRLYKMCHDPENVSLFLSLWVWNDHIQLWKCNEHFHEKRLSTMNEYVKFTGDKILWTLFWQIKPKTAVCLSQGQRSELVEPVGGGEWDQTGAETALLLHTQAAVPSHSVTQLTEGTTQQPPSRLTHFYLFTLLKYYIIISANHLTQKWVSPFLSFDTFVKTKCFQSIWNRILQQVTVFQILILKHFFA